MSIFQRIRDAVREVFSGGRDSAPSGGSDRAPTSSRRPQEKPRVLSRDTDSGREFVSTRDMPRFGIEAGQRAMEPEFGAFSLRSMTDRSPGNIMRNIQAADRYAREAVAQEDDTPTAKPEPAPEPEPEVEETPEPTPEPTPPPVETETGLTPEQETRIEQAGEQAAQEQSQLGRAQTIATSPRGIDSTIVTTPGGLLVSGGTTRRRRSLIGGGMIQ